SQSRDSLLPSLDRRSQPPSPALPGRIFSRTVATEPSGIRSNDFWGPLSLKSSDMLLLLSLCCFERLVLGWGNDERLTLTGAGQLFDQLAEMRLLDLIEAASAVLGGIVPGIGQRANEGAHRCTIPEVDPLHGDDLVDDAGQLAAGARALYL